MASQENTLKSCKSSDECQSSHNEKSANEKLNKAKARRPDLQVYVPRGRRSQLPADVASSKCSEETLQSVSIASCATRAKSVLQNVHTDQKYKPSYELNHSVVDNLNDAQRLSESKDKNDFGHSQIQSATNARRKISVGKSKGGHRKNAVQQSSSLETSGSQSSDFVQCDNLNVSIALDTVNSCSVETPTSELASQCTNLLVLTDGGSCSSDALVSRQKFQSKQAHVPLSSFGDLLSNGASRSVADSEEINIIIADARRSDNILLSLPSNPENVDLDSSCQQLLTEKNRPGVDSADECCNVSMKDHHLDDPTVSKNCVNVGCLTVMPLNMVSAETVDHPSILNGSAPPCTMKALDNLLASVTVKDVIDTSLIDVNCSTNKPSCDFKEVHVANSGEDETAVCELDNVQGTLCDIQCDIYKKTYEIETGVQKKYDHLEAQLHDRENFEVKLCCSDREGSRETTYVGSIDSPNRRVALEKVPSDTLHMEGGDDDEDWDHIYDESGNVRTTGSVQYDSSVEETAIVSKSYIDYYTYQAKDIDVSNVECGHLIEIYDFPTSFQTCDLLGAFPEYRDRGFDVKWVDDTHAIGVFASSIAANSVLSCFSNPMMKIRSIDSASRQTKLKAKRTSEFLQPYKARPQTTASVARSLVAGALGLQNRVPKEKREEERRKLKEAKERKREVVKLKDEAWDGNIFP